MSQKIKVDIFGVKGQPVASCGCEGGDCGPTPTMDDQVEELEKYLNEQGLNGKVEVNFLDIVEDDVQDLQTIQDMVDQGYTPPFTAIDGQMKFYGGISPEMIYKEVMKSK